jgi:hypothetical protein
MNNPEEDKIIYCIVDAAGKFYNAEKKYYANVLYLGTFYSTAQNAQSFIIGHNLEAQVQETNYNDFAESIATFTTKATIQAESLITNFRQIKYSLPTVKGLNHKLDNSLEKTINLMKMFNPMFQEFLNKKEDNTYDVTGYYEEFVEEIASVELYNCADLTKIIQAYKKDKASVMGISNKILR